MSRDMGMEEVHQVKDAPLVMPRQQPVRPIHSLQPVLVLIAAELVVVRKAPRQGPDYVHAVLVDALERLGQEVLVVQGALQVLALVLERTVVLAVDGEAELGYHEPRGPERVPHVAELLPDVLRRDVRVGV